MVEIDELIGLVGMALGRESSQACATASHCVAIDDIVTAVTQALAGCGSS